jgi:hypothetical protein
MPTIRGAWLSLALATTSCVRGRGFQGVFLHTHAFCGVCNKDMTIAHAQLKLQQPTTKITEPDTHTHTHARAQE